MNDSIRKLKALLDSGLSQAETRRRLEAERDAVEGELNALLAIIEQTHENSRWKMQEPDMDEREKQKDLIASIRYRVQEIDHLLDELEGDYEQKLKDMREQLIEGILEARPVEKVSHDLRLKKIETINLLCQELYSLHEPCKQLIGKLKNAVHAWQSSGKRSLLHYIFGKNPAIAASNLLSDTQTLSGNYLKTLSELPQNPHRSYEISLHYSTLKTDVATFLRDYDKHWNESHFKNVFTPYLETLESADEKFDAFIVVLEQEKQLIEDEIDRWLEQFSL